MLYKTLENGKRWAFCEQCQKPLPIYQKGAVPEGYVSPELWKIESEMVEGVAGMKPICRVVCNSCYIAAWSRQYPDQKCQLAPEEGELPEWVSQSLQDQHLKGTK